MHKRTNKENGMAIVLSLILLAIGSGFLVFMLVNSEQEIVAARYSENSYLQQNSADLGLQYSEVMFNDYLVSGLKATFNVLDEQGQVIPPEQGGEQEIALQAFKGDDVNGDAYGLDDGDSADFLFIGNTRNIVDAVTQTPVGSNAWTKTAGNTLQEDYLSYQFQSTDHDDIQPFAFTGVAAPNGGITQEADGSITIPEVLRPYMSGQEVIKA